MNHAPDADTAREVLHGVGIDVEMFDQIVVIQTAGKKIQKNFVHEVYKLLDAVSQVVILDLERKRNISSAIVWPNIHFVCVDAAMFG